MRLKQGQDRSRKKRKDGGRGGGGGEEEEEERIKDETEKMGINVSDPKM